MQASVETGCSQGEERGGPAWRWEVGQRRMSSLAQAGAGVLLKVY